MTNELYCVGVAVHDLRQAGFPVSRRWSAPAAP